MPQHHRTQAVLVSGAFCWLRNHALFTPLPCGTLNSKSLKRSLARRGAPEPNIYISIDAQRRCGFLAYAGISFALFGRALLGNFERCHLGLGNDPSFLMWALVWWPHAIRHGLNPFICRLVWAPDGFNLAWSGGIPLLSIAFSTAHHHHRSHRYLQRALSYRSGDRRMERVHTLPKHCTILGGIYRRLSLRILTIHAWTVDRRASKSNVGISGAADRMEHAARNHHRISRVSFATLLTVLFVVQFLCSIELAASVAIFGAIAFLLGWYLGDNTNRLRLRSVLAPIVWSAGASLLVLSPYLFYLFQPNGPRTAINSPGAFSADLANLMIPTRTIEFGLINVFQAIREPFPGKYRRARRLPRFAATLGYFPLRLDPMA